MTAFSTKVRTAFLLGAPNLMRVAAYRMGIATGVNPVRRLSADLPSGPFFESKIGQSNEPFLHQDKVGAVSFFGWHKCPIGQTPPDWHSNVLNGHQVEGAEQEWWRISDFDSRTGDIKGVWDASRFDWVLSFAQSARAGDCSAIEILNIWLEDWCRNNPPYRGVNWKCGQEASIRVMHLAMAARILGNAEDPTQGLVDLIGLHLKRIEPTIQYAMAQDNNHGTSEAAALFIGGSWLRHQDHPRGAHWEQLGRKWLENRAARLIEKDGSFSQYSLNYHRVMLDTMSMVEVWRRTLELPKFSQRFQERCRKAAEWLWSFVQPETGDVPNIGANDGARLLPLTNTDYRDFRPSVQLATALFANNRAYPEEGDWDLPLDWLGIDRDLPLGNLKRESRIFPDGGYVQLAGDNTWAAVRFARFRFRPSHADCLHFDLWHRGKNLLRDGGTYSYNTDPQWLNYFPGTASHNTLQFDGRDQMPRLGRFLFGAWLKMDHLSEIERQGEAQSWSGAYTDGKGAHHHRTVTVCGDRWLVKDEISGFQDKAVLRWRLAPSDWYLQDNRCRSSLAQITIHTDADIRRMELGKGWESLYYFQKTELPVLEVEVGPGHWTLETEIVVKE